MRYSGPGIRALVTLAALCAVASSRLAAQSAQAFSIQVSGLYMGFGGTAYADMSIGTGGEAQLRYTSGAMSLGIGYQYTRHTMMDEEGSMSNAGAFIEPRFVFATSSPNLAPYLSARLSLLQMKGIMPENSEKSPRR